MAPASDGALLRLLLLLLLFPGGFISPFIDIYGCRPVAMTFALLYAVATTLSAFAPTIGSLYFIYSALTGKASEPKYLMFTHLYDELAILICGDVIFQNVILLS